jgi:hypothetical protein
MVRRGGKDLAMAKRKTFKRDLGKNRGKVPSYRGDVRQIP